jgi:hypothetical protein
MTLSVLPCRNPLPAIAFLALALAGCGKAKGPETFPVTGAVTMDGKPVAEAMIQFTPASASAEGGIAAGMAGAQARTDAEGRYAMSIMLDQGKTTKPGLPAGDYIVSVQKLEFPGGAASATSPPHNVLPAKYATAQTSPLKATVKANGENHFDFPL